MITRIYVVTAAGQESLVSAVSPAAALRHVARRTMDVAVAKQADLVRLLTAGIAVETAGVDESQLAIEFPDPADGNDVGVGETTAPQTGDTA